MVGDRVIMFCLMFTALMGVVHWAGYSFRLVVLLLNNAAPR